MGAPVSYIILFLQLSHLFVYNQGAAGPPSCPAHHILQLWHQSSLLCACVVFMVVTLFGPICPAHHILQLWHQPSL